MQIEDAILGLLHGRPMSGYDLKREMTDSPHMLWSGNNNQIYKALLQLSNQGLVTSETIHREGAPSKKVYTLTAAGRMALTAWLASLQPELPEIRKPFLVQLSLAARIGPETLPDLLRTYLEELDAQHRMQRERRRRLEAQSGADGASRAGVSAAGTVLDPVRLVDQAILERIDRFYSDETDWAGALLARLEKPAPSAGGPKTRPAKERKQPHE